MASHPILTCVEEFDAALRLVVDVNPTFMPTPDKGVALMALAQVEAQVSELRLRIMAGAGDVAEETAARDVAAWLHHHTRTDAIRSRADLRLAESLDRRYHAVASALRNGECNLAQAEVIARAIDELPADVDPETRVRAEEHPVSLTPDFDPAQLRRLGRRILDVVAPEVAEAAEARRLADLESDARRRTKLTLKPSGDGTTRISGVLPDATANRLATYLAAFTNPRRADEILAGDDRPFARLSYPRKLGEAFGQLLESIDPLRLPVHGGDATTLVVTIPLESLIADLGVAELPDGERITASEARRLACNASILPAVMGGKSEVLDLGRSQRLFSKAQRKALLIRDRTCRAEGCDIPGTWAEAHHWVPWSVGGRTNLDDGVLFCSCHHHRAHDPAYMAERLPSGEVRFHRRR